MYLSKLIMWIAHLGFSLTGGHAPSVFHWIILYQSQHAQGLPEVIRIIISIKQMAEESNEEPLRDGYRINNVFLSFIDLSFLLLHSLVSIYRMLAGSCIEWVSNATTEGRFESSANGVLHAPSGISYRKQVSSRWVSWGTAYWWKVGFL